MRHIISAFALLLMVVCASFAQTKDVEKKVSLEEGEVIKVDASLVSFSVVVSDKKGRYIPGLNPQNFSVFENGVQQEIDVFTSNSEPFHVVLLVDVSGSTTEAINAIKDAARAFVSNLRDDDKMVVVSFADRIISSPAQFTNNRVQLVGAINLLFNGGSTRLYDAVYYSAHNLLKTVTGRKAIIILSDGIDTASTKRPEQAIDEILESGTQVYVVKYPLESQRLQFMPSGSQIALPRRHDDSSGQPTYTIPNTQPHQPHQPTQPNYDPGRPMNTTPIAPRPDTVIPKGGKGFFSSSFVKGFAPTPTPAPSPAPTPQVLTGQDLFLDRLVDATGGTLFSANIFGDLSNQMRIVAEQLRNTYTIGYYPSTPVEKGGYRKIKIKTEPKAASVRHRKGYDAARLRTILANTKS